MQNVTKMKVIVECQEFNVTIAWDENESNLDVAAVKQRVIAKVRQARSSVPPHVSDLALDSICLQYESDKKGRITLNASRPFSSYGIPDGSTLKTMFPTIPAVSCIFRIFRSPSVVNTSEAPISCGVREGVAVTRRH